MVKRIALLVVAFACVIGLGYAATLAGHSDDRDDNDTLQITIRDFCDKNTFPAGLCTGNGKIAFAAFNAELAAFKDAGSWKFVPDVAATEEGVNLTLTNVGGETHTFTRVAKFGGGFVAGLNIASGNPVPAPECARVVDGRLVPQPPSANNMFINAGQTLPGPRIVEDEEARFQCCIHPWMRTTLNPKEHEHERHQD